MQAGSTPTSTDSALLAELALSRGDLVQEWGYDDDVDVTFRDALEDALGEELLTEEDQEPADAVLFWWRADDGDVMRLRSSAKERWRRVSVGPPSEDRARAIMEPWHPHGPSPRPSSAA